MRAVICPDQRRVHYEAEQELDLVGGRLFPGGRLEAPDGEVTLFMTWSMARYRLLGLRLTDVRFIAPESAANRRDYLEVRQIAKRCLV